MVSIVAMYSGQVGLPDLGQLLLGELAGVGSAVVKEPVALHQTLELVSNQTLKKNVPINNILRRSQVSVISAFSKLFCARQRIDNSLVFDCRFF